MDEILSHDRFSVVRVKRNLWEKFIGVKQAFICKRCRKRMRLL